MSSWKPFKQQIRRKKPIPKKLVIHKPIYFLHIMKCGGTSIDSLMNNLVRQGKIKRYIGNQHYDYSYIASKGIPRVNIEFITILRNPVSRAVSNFYFSKTGKWTKDFIMRKQTFSEYIRDEKSMKQYRAAIRDGEGGYNWLAGVHPGVSWVLTDKKNRKGGYNWLAGVHPGVSWVLTDKKNRKKKDELLKNKKECLLVAARNLDKTLWFGLLEDIPRSMELLKHTFKLKTIPKLPRRNKNNYPKLPKEDIKLVEKHLEGDIWLYNYAKLLFEARWNYYKSTSTNNI